MTSSSLEIEYGGVYSPVPLMTTCFMVKLSNLAIGALQISEANFTQTGSTVESFVLRGRGKCGGSLIFVAWTGAGGIACDGGRRGRRVPAGLPPNCLLFLLFLDIGLHHHRFGLGQLDR